MESPEYGADPFPDRRQIIDWHMMDLYRFYPLTFSCSIAVRGCMYPLTVVKTRMQIQKQNTVYSGMFNAMSSIARTEGIRGLYKGYWISTFHIAVGAGYVTIYELVRHFLKSTNTVTNHSARGFIAGGTASACCQLVAVPIDIVSQHMMIIGQLDSKSNSGRISGKIDSKHSKHARVADPLNLVKRIEERRRAGPLRFYGLGGMVVKEVWRRDGIIGFYRGFLSSLMLYVPNSALFWWSYHEYCLLLADLMSNKDLKYIWVQGLAAPAAGITTTTALNSMDLFRARIQVQRASYAETARTLWRDERWQIFVKGLYPRLISSTIFSFLSVIGYESLKRMSVKEPYRDSIRW